MSRLSAAPQPPAITMTYSSAGTPCTYTTPTTAAGPSPSMPPTKPSLKLFLRTKPAPQAQPAAAVASYILHPNNKLYHATYLYHDGSWMFTRTPAIPHPGYYTRRVIKYIINGVGQESSLSYLSAVRCPLTTLWESVESSLIQDGAHPAVIPDTYWV